MLIRTFVLKITTNKKKIETHHGIIDHTAEQILLECKETKLWIHQNLQRPNFAFTYSFKFIYFCIVDV